MHGRPDTSPHICRHNSSPQLPKPPPSLTRCTCGSNSRSYAHTCLPDPSSRSATFALHSSPSIYNETLPSRSLCGLLPVQLRRKYTERRRCQLRDKPAFAASPFCRCSERSHKHFPPVRTVVNVAVQTRVQMAVL